MHAAALQLFSHDVDAVLSVCVRERESARARERASERERARERNAHIRQHKTASSAFEHRAGAERES